MAFCHRVFCLDSTSPSLSEVLVWLRQRGFPAQLATVPGVGQGEGGDGGGATAPEDLLSGFWQTAAIAIEEGVPPLGLVCLRPDASGLSRLTEEVADFVGDVRELPASPARSQVLGHLAATRQLLVIEFPPEGDTPSTERAAESLAALFVERAGGLTQRDGVGFMDEDDDLILALG